MASKEILHALEDVDAAWFTAALQTRYPGVEVVHAECSTTIRGMATKAQFHLTYNDAGRVAGLPPSMWLKAGFEAHSEASAPLYVAEVCFYKDVAAKLDINCAATYYEALQPQQGSGILLLEDLTLRGARFGSPTDNIDIDTAKRVLNLMTRYHPAPQLPHIGAQDIAWLQAPSAIDIAQVIDQYLQFWDVAARQPRFQFVPDALLDRQRIRRAIHRMRDNDRFGPRSWLVHGDAHMGNMFFEANGEPGFLDWQTTMLGEWASDVSEFLVFSLDVEARRRHERELIKHYLDALADSGVATPSFDEAWLSYRQHAAWSFLTVMCPVEMHPESTCMAWAQRACAAIIDLETLQALED